MAKRDREDSAAANGANGAQIDVVAEPVTKKIKKDKKKHKSTKDQDVAPAAPATEDTVDGEAEKSAKSEAKALKKAQKLAAKAEADGQKNGTAEEQADGDDASDAAKAAIKAQRKAARRAEKDAAKNGAAKSNGHAVSKTVASTPSDAPNAAASSSGYTEDPKLTAISQSEIDAFIEEKFISTTDPDESGPAYRPITSFKYLPITDEAQRAPFATYTTPTPIQAAAWPYLLAGRDVIGVAETGSGKTMAFGVPCIKAITSLPVKEQKRGIRACMVSPTRELALQIYEQLEKLAAPAGLKCACVYGGVNKDMQRETLRGASIIIATPGRLNDYISEGSIDLGNVGYLVLDEADRMLDKGFEEEIRKIINTTPKTGRQTLMFTATWPESVRELAKTFMSSPVKIAIGDNPTGELRANTRIVQEVEVMDPYAKNDRLLQLLKQYQSGKNKSDRILVFCLYKKEATRIEGFIRQRGFAVAGIHGDLSQQQRTASLEAFKQGKVPLLVATDVAARGLDIPAVKVVINVTFPLTVEDYVHRIGR